MIDAEQGYYSPNETIDYIPASEVGTVRAFFAASAKDCKILCFETQRYLRASFDPDFLASAASRRDLWRILLPLPPIFSMAADRGDYELMLMNVALSVTLFLMSSLPRTWLLSDVVFCLLFGSYIPLHSVLGFGPPSVGEASGPALATLTMAAAGVNVWILLAFVIVSYATAPYVAYAWTSTQLLACLYVVFVMTLVEQRATRMHVRGSFQPSGYKALISADDPASANASRGPVDHLSSRYTADTLSRGIGSDGEDAAPPPPAEGEEFAFLNGLMAKIRGEHRSSGPVSSIFARFGHNTGQRSVTSTSSGPRHRFAADKVQPPGAAVHEAPRFAEREMEFLMRDGDQAADQCPEAQPWLQKAQTGESNGSLFPGSPSGDASPRCFPQSPAASTPGQFYRAVKLGGFDNPHLNALFVERTSPAFRVNGRETFWPTSGYYFIYRSMGTNTWGIAKAKRFEAVKVNKSNGVAHSPEGFELWLEVNETQTATKKNWREWDVQANKWVSRPGAGVVSRGKVRPKAMTAAAKSEVAVQASVEVSDATAQTIARVTPKSLDTHAHDASVTLSSMALGTSSMQTSPQGKSHHKAGGDVPYRGGSTDTLLGLPTESQGVRRPSVRLDPPTSGERRSSRSNSPSRGA